MATVGVSEMKIMCPGLQYVLVLDVADFPIIGAEDYGRGASLIDEEPALAGVKGPLSSRLPASSDTVNSAPNLPPVIGLYRHIRYLAGVGSRPLAIPATISKSSRFRMTALEHGSSDLDRRGSGRKPSTSASWSRRAYHLQMTPTSFSPKRRGWGGADPPGG